MVLALYTSIIFTFIALSHRNTIYNLYKAACAAYVTFTRRRSAVMLHGQIASLLLVVVQMRR